MNKYTTETEITDIVRGFETGTLPRNEFSHASHLVVVLNYVRQMTVDEAVEKMRFGLMNHLRLVGVDFTKENPYHETLTVFWTRTVADFNASKNGASLLDVANEMVEVFSKELPLTFYSREYLFSDEARKTYLAPDLNNNEQVNTGSADVPSAKIVADDLILKNSLKFTNRGDRGNC
jgi:hypothetical protein